MTRFEKILRADPDTLSEAQAGWRKIMLRKIAELGMTLDEFCDGLTEDDERQVSAWAERTLFQNRIVHGVRK